MSDDDRARWNERWAAAGAVGSQVQPPFAFTDHLDAFPTEGRALDVACGRGEASVWLALRGMRVRGVDASDTAVSMAAQLGDANDVSDVCEFVEWDLDTGLPFGEPVDLLLCHMFRDERLYSSMIDRLAPGGVLAIAVRSEVGGAPGPYAAAQNELSVAFAELEHIVAHEGDGLAWLLARRAA